MTLPRNRRILLAVTGGVLLLAVTAAYAAFKFRKSHRSPEEEAPKWVDAKRIRSGDTVIANNDNKLIYAGVRAPVEGEPLFEEARARNATLVEGKKLRLRFDADERDKQDRLVAYAWVDKEFVNDILVREGLAYARLTPATTRYAEELLAAQAEARSARRGLWNLTPPPAEHEYWADAKYGNFHRPNCEERQKAKSERIQTLKSRDNAFERGLAPCPKCKP
jgi:micrococcal nuclease